MPGNERSRPAGLLLSFFVSGSSFRRYRRYSGIRVKLPSTRSGTSLSFCHFHDDWLQTKGAPLTVGVP